jgi:hypothetical protein
VRNWRIPFFEKCQLRLAVAGEFWEGFMRKGIGAPGMTGAKKAVRVNGVMCESLTAGAEEATRALGRKIHLYQIHRILNGKLEIAGLNVEAI